VLQSGVDLIATFFAWNRS